MTDELLFYDAYEDFYKMASNSGTFKAFCKEAYGADFSQDGFSDIKQIDMILPYIKDENAHILDIGCGNGKMLCYLQVKTGAHIHGFDYSANAIKHAKENNKSADFRVAVMDEIGYPGNSFDLIISMDSIYFAADMKSFIEKVRNWLRPGGVFFVAYQEGDVMEKSEDAKHSVFAKAMKDIGWDYELRDISADSFDMLTKKREVALKYKEKFENEGNGSWGDLFISQTDYILQGKEEYLSQLARYIFICRK